MTTNNIETYVVWLDNKQVMSFEMIYEDPDDDEEYRDVQHQVRSLIRTQFPQAKITRLLRFPCAAIDSTKFFK